MRKGARIPKSSAVDRGDERAEDEPADVEGREVTEVGADMLGVARDHDPANGRSDRAAAEPEQEPREDERPELRSDGAAQHRQRGHDHTATHHERDVAAVGVARQEELGAEPGEETGGDDEAELGSREAESIAQVGEQRVDRPVPERHAARHEEVRKQLSPTHCPTASNSSGDSLVEVEASNASPRISRCRSVGVASRAASAWLLGAGRGSSPASSCSRSMLRGHSPPRARMSSPRSMVASMPSRSVRRNRQSSGAWLDPIVIRIAAFTFRLGARRRRGTHPVARGPVPTRAPRPPTVRVGTSLLGLRAKGSAVVAGRARPLTHR